MAATAVPTEAQIWEYSGLRRITAISSENLSVAALNQDRIRLWAS